MIKKKRLYSGICNLPAGRANDTITEGCLVLEGGAFRGLYTSGVCDALMEADINFRCTVGVSAGAMNGMNYVAGQIGRSARINLRYRHDSRYVGLQAIRHNHGLIGFDFVFGHMDDVPDFDMARFEQPGREFYAVVTSVDTAQPEFFGKDCGASIYQAVRASASMPYVSQPVAVCGKHYLDGGCSLNIPYQWAIDRGFEKILVVRTRTPDFRKPIKPADAEEPHHSPEDVYRRSHPLLAEALHNADERYNRECVETEELRASGRIAVIAPSEKLDISRLEPDMEKLGWLYWLGYHDAEQEIPQIREYLLKKSQSN